MKYSGIITLIISITLFSCKTEDIILHGDLTGTVTDAETSLPVSDAKVILKIANDTTITSNDGTFHLKNLNPGQYEIQASKETYDVGKQIANVESAATNRIDFLLNGIPVPNPSVKFLDFGLDSILRFSISNLGRGKFTYILIASKDWINMNPKSGEITNDTVNITVTINKTGLSNSIYKETIKIISYTGQTPLPEIIIPVILNGVVDRDGNYYKIVRIGPQIWMAENLNVGTEISVDKSSTNNGIIEKHCYSESKNYCDIYGGLYQWDEMMQYTTADSGQTGTRQGICPVGWHVPTQKEWAMLAENVGGVDHAGAQLKEAGFSHWSAPNVGATNVSNFTALPGGFCNLQNGPDFAYFDLSYKTYWWTATEYYLESTAYFQSLSFDSEFLYPAPTDEKNGYSVRCAKDPGKK